jgi:iron complex transport system ATP-binding protein
VSLRLDDLCVDLGGRRIVTGIDITVGDGQFVGLLGPNGSGKSTILKAIYRVHKASHGRVLLDGADLLAMRPREAARRVAVVTQEFVSEFDFTVREIVMIGRTPHKQAFSRDTEADRRAALAAMERTGCAHLAGRSFNSLSGGEKQLTLVARALAQGADHLVLDEPTNHLDIHYQMAILELVAGLSVSVLAALHDLSMAALFCGSVYVLAGGHIVAGGPPRAVITPATIRAAYGADVLVVEHPDTGTPHLIPRRSRPAADQATTHPEGHPCHPVTVTGPPTAAPDAS